MSDTSVVWRLGVDSHEELVELVKLRDDTADPHEMTFCRVEISPKNGCYLKPDEWLLKIDQERPSWWTAEHAEAAQKAHREWLAKLNEILIKKPVVNPFRDIKPPKKIGKQHLILLQRWDSVWDSVWASVGYSVGDSVGVSVGDSVWDSVRDSVGVSVWASVRDSVWAYIGSFFTLPCSAWKYAGKIKIAGYPFQSAVDLWMMGIVSSFDGGKWRLHGGKKAKILWEGTPQELGLAVERKGE